MPLSGEDSDAAAGTFGDPMATRPNRMESDSKESGPLLAPAPPERTAERLCFGVFELDGASLELTRNGQPRRLPPQPAKLLHLLARNSGRVVTRDEIRRALWGDEIVVDFEHGVHAAVRQIRAALGDQAAGARFIETLPKRGYRFLAEVRIEAAPITPAAVATPSGDPRTQQPEDPRPRRVGVAALAAVSAIGLLWLASALSRAVRPGVLPPPEGRLRLAVLPFQSDFGDADRAYFAEGLTEELIFRLAALQPDRLEVIARSSVQSFPAGASSVEDVGRALDVQYVLEGRIQTKDDKLSVTTSLAQVQGEVHVWSATYEDPEDDLPALQARVTAEVARSLEVGLLIPSAPEAAPADVVRAAAYDEYLRGRFEWNRFQGESLRAAIEHYEAALELDPTLARAWASMAEAYDLLPFNGVLPVDQAYPRAKEVAARALELDETLAGAHNALGFAALYFDWDWDASDDAFSRAVELEPHYAMAHHWYAGLLSAVERHEEAIDHLLTALRLDPLSLSVRSDLAWYYAYADRFEEAVLEAQETLRRDPGYGWARYGLAIAQTRLGREEDALATIETMLGRELTTELAGVESEARLDVAWSHCMGFPLGEEMEPGIRNDFDVGCRLAMSGRTDAALETLQIAVDERDGWVVFLRVDPRLDALRNDPRFEALVRRVGLP